MCINCWRSIAIYSIQGPPGINQTGQTATGATAPSPQLPYPVQGGNMPMPYTTAPGTPYPAYVPPPMPTTYNPYATMPYATQGTRDICNSVRIVCALYNNLKRARSQSSFSRFPGGYNPYQAMPQAPYGGYATLPRYGGANPPHGHHHQW